MAGKLFLLISFCVASHFLIAQDKIKIDSLNQELANAKEDTNKVNTLNALSRQLWKSGELDQAKKLSDEALALASSLYIGNKQGWPKGIATAYNNTGNISIMEGDYEKALENHMLSLKIRIEINDQQGMADSYGNIASIYSYQGNYSEALKSNLVCLKIYESLDNKQGMANTYGNMGIIFKSQGNYSEALKSHFAALRIRKKIGDRSGIAYSYSSIGNIYWYEGNYPEALKNQLASLKIREEIGDKYGIAYSYENIGTIYGNQRNYKEALSYFSASLKIHEELGDKNGSASAHNNIGSCYENEENFTEAIKNYLISLKINTEMGNKAGIATSLENIGFIKAIQGDYTQALKNHFEALKMKEEIGDKYGTTISFINIGNVYTKQKRISEAITYLNRALLIGKEIGATDLVKDVYAALSAAAITINDYKKGYEYHLLFSGIKDTLLNEENNKHIAEMQVQYESEKKDAQILVLNKDNELQTQQANQQRIIRNILIAGFAIALLVAFLFINRLRLHQLLKLQLIRNNIASDLHDDVGSVLSSIAIFSELANEEVKDKSPKAVALLQNINENARATIDAMSDTVWAINPKNDRFENIMVRMRTFAAGILEAKNIDLSFPATPALSDLKLSMEKRKNLYLLFKEAVNNVAKYSACKNCTIQLGLEGKKLSMDITDDGIGFDMNDHPTGNGQINMKKRSEELRGAFDIKSAKGQGTRVHLSFTT